MRKHLFVTSQHISIRHTQIERSPQGPKKNSAWLSHHIATYWQQQKKWWKRLQAEVFFRCWKSGMAEKTVWNFMAFSFQYFVRSRIWCSVLRERIYRHTVKRNILTTSWRTISGADNSFFLSIFFFSLLLSVRVKRDYVNRKKKKNVGARTRSLGQQTLTDSKCNSMKWL